MPTYAARLDSFTFNSSSTGEWLYGDPLVVQHGLRDIRIAWSFDHELKGINAQLSYQVLMIDGTWYSPVTLGYIDLNTVMSPITVELSPWFFDATQVTKGIKVMVSGQPQTPAITLTTSIYAVDA